MASIDVNMPQLIAVFNAIPSLLCAASQFIAPSSITRIILVCNSIQLSSCGFRLELRNGNSDETNDRNAHERRIRNPSVELVGVFFPISIKAMASNSKIYFDEAHCLYSSIQTMAIFIWLTFFPFFTRKMWVLSVVKWCIALARLDRLHLHSVRI